MSVEDTASTCRLVFKGESACPWYTYLHMHVCGCGLVSLDGLKQRCLMRGGIHYEEFEGLVSVERWSGSRGAHVWWRTLWGG